MCNPFYIFYLLNQPEQYWIYAQLWILELCRISNLQKGSKFFLLAWNSYLTHLQWLSQSLLITHMDKTTIFIFYIVLNDVTIHIVPKPENLEWSYIFPLYIHSGRQEISIWISLESHSLHVDQCFISYSQSLLIHFNHSFLIFDYYILLYILKSIFLNLIRGNISINVYVAKTYKNLTTVKGFWGPTFNN